MTCIRPSFRSRSNVASTEDPEKLAAFEARVAADEFIEPKDWMPEAYRRTLVRQISQHAHPRSSACCRRATGSPARRRCGARRSCWPRCRTRRATASTSIRAAETLGTSREEMIEALHSGKAKYSTIFNYPTLDLGRHRRDRLAGRRRGDHEPGAAAAHLLRPLCARHGAGLQGGELPPAPGLRDHDGDGRRDRRRRSGWRRMR